jgi:hypothetical protein
MAGEVQDSKAFLCVTCGTQFAPDWQVPATCPICADPRQYLGLDGQQWTTLTELRSKSHNVIVQEEPDLYSIHSDPPFAIGQRAFLLRTPAGNVLWDCIALLDAQTIEAIEQLGGIAAIAISHPHYYTTMIEWSAAFADAPIHLHEADRQWVMRPHANIHYWSGSEHSLFGNLRLLNTPGHFDGFQVLHWPAGAEGRGALLSGDQPQVCMDTDWVSFMWSYPNFVPLSIDMVKELMKQYEHYSFDRIYGAFPKRTVRANAKAALRQSAERYIRATGARLND